MSDGVSIEVPDEILTIDPSQTSKMAGPGAPHVPRIYRIAGTGLGASMWFFVRYLLKIRTWNEIKLTGIQLFYRAKKDGTGSLFQRLTMRDHPMIPADLDTNHEVYRSRPPRLEAPLGSLNGFTNSVIDG